MQCYKAVLRVTMVTDYRFTVRSPPKTAEALILYVLKTTIFWFNILDCVVGYFCVQLLECSLTLSVSDRQ